MKYMVKCSYCEKTFMVDVEAPEADFICESCGGTNDKSNVVQEIKPQKSVVWRSGNKSEDEAWKAIKSFDLSEHEGKGDEEPSQQVAGFDSYSNADTGKGALAMHVLAALSIPVVLLFICLIGAFLG